MFGVATLPSLFTAWASGTATGLGLFAVVGAQTTFILRQGLMRAYLPSILMLCALLDGIFIFVSVWGLQAATRHVPWLGTIILWPGIAFLAWYGFQAGRRALKPGSGLAASRAAASSRRAALLSAAGFTLLNPHFWLDMMLVGSLAHGFADARLGFAAGALSASVIWLSVLGLGARLLAPLFANPRAWRVLDGAVAIVMVLLAIGLAWKGI